mgnify:CR=1 FL=1
MSESNTSVGFSFEFVLFVVFLVLKLTGTIDWSWWWVISPLWISFAIVAVIFFSFALF